MKHLGDSGSKHITTGDTEDNKEWYFEDDAESGDDSDDSETEYFSSETNASNCSTQKSVSVMLKSILFDLDENNLSIKNQSITKSTTPDSTDDIYQKRKELTAKMVQIYKTHHKSLHSTSRLCKLNRKCSKTNFNNKDQVMEMKSLQEEAVEKTKKEIELANQAIEMIHNIRALLKGRKCMPNGSMSTITRNELIKKLPSLSATMPLFIGKVSEKVPALCGSVPCEPDHVAQPGDYVAVNGAQIDSSNGTDWILAEVIHYDHQTQCYEVDDVGEDEKKSFLLNRKHTVPLPKWRANPKTNPEAIYPRNTLVLAMYPTSTCFYKGVVKQLPKDPSDSYLISFSDPNHPDFYSGSVPVPQQLVIPRPD